MKITKKEFISKYPQMRLCGVLDKELQEVLPIISKAPKATIENTKETSRYDIETCKNIGMITTVHKTTNTYNTFYIVYTVRDCSKDSNVSWNDILHECVVYVLMD